ncbi:MAG: hypothetical protein GY778_29830 [bacterium]|nr:hypothetical protein [bacterium]
MRKLGTTTATLGMVTAAGALWLTGSWWAQAASSDAPRRPSAVAATSTTEPLTVIGAVPGRDAIRFQLQPEALRSFAAQGERRRLDLPLPGRNPVTLDLCRFDVVGADTRFVLAGAQGQIDVAPPMTIMFRGQVVGVDSSRVYLAFSDNGLATGRVVLDDGMTYVLRSDPGSPDANTVILERANGTAAWPDFPEFCGISVHPTHPPISGAPRGTGPTAADPRVARVAIDADQSYVNLFPNPFAAHAYITQLIGAVSDIYIRDLDVALSLSFVRLWPAGGEPFSADDLSGFASYWTTQQDPSGYNLVHMLSGRRDLPYGGVAYVGGTCSGQATYAISGFLLGGMPAPVGPPSLENWDLTVTAHEMGHNMGTYHTHDGYFPTLDDCGNGVPAIGTIMSYCHTHPGGVLNIDLRFHRVVQDLIAGEVASNNCFAYDCNTNGVDDTDDILLSVSTDLNGNQVPDECEDCNTNGQLDPADIAGGAPDVDNNGVPDACQADCNGNTTPDEHEIEQNQADDVDANTVPDTCDPDCNTNGIADMIEIQADLSLDLDRNRVLDACQDCNTNGLSDWIDLDRQYNWYLADLGGFVREYHGISGVPVGSLASGSVANPHDATFGPDRQLYLAGFGDDRIVRVDVDTDTAITFVAAGSGGLNGPTALVFGSNGNLFVTSRDTHEVLEYDGATGAPVGTFVSAGLGGLTQPYGLTFGPSGDLYVTSSNNTVIRYNGSNGALIGTFVTASSGGLNGPRGLVFKNDGELLVASTNTDSVLAYDGTTGAFLGVFTGSYAPTGAWGIRLNRAGNVLVVRSTGTLRVIEYDAASGRYVRSYLRGDPALTGPTGLAQRPQSPNDANANGVLDACETWGDWNATGVIDLADSAVFFDCLAGPDQTPAPTAPVTAAGCLAFFDGDQDQDVDLSDFDRLMREFD